MATTRTTTVVLADDVPEVRAALRELLDSAHDIEVVAEVGSAEEAVRSCATHRPRVAVLDVRMPGDGLAAARKITEAGTAGRVVVLTAYDTPEIRDDAHASGASFFVVKSDGDDLVEAIRLAG